MSLTAAYWLDFYKDDTAFWEGKPRILNMSRNLPHTYIGWHVFNDYLLDQGAYPLACWKDFHKLHKTEQKARALNQGDTRLQALIRDLILEVARAIPA